VLQSGIEIPYIAIKTNIAESLDVIVHTERRPGQRVVAEVLTLRGFDPDLDKYNFDFVYQYHAESRHRQLTSKERQ
jgi:Flp pilus assembly CpaF family ATPase